MPQKNVYPIVVRKSVKQRKREGSKFRKDKACLTKMLIPPSACEAQEERVGEWELVQSDCRAEYKDMKS